MKRLSILSSILGAGLAVSLSAGLAGPAAAMQVLSPGGPPNLAVEVPDTATLQQQPNQTTIFLAPGTLPVLTLGTVPFDPTKIDLTDPTVYAVLALDAEKNIAQELGGSVVSPGASSNVFVGGKPGYIFHGIVENQGGGRFSVEVIALKIDPSHVGLFALISAEGREAVGGLEAAMRAATVIKAP